MSEQEQAQQEAEVVETPAPDTQTEGVQDQQQTDGGEAETGPDPKVEERAREMGWVPQGEWRGDPEQWRDADEFVRRGEEVLPIVRSQLDREKAKSADLESRLSKMEKEYSDRYSRLEKMNKVALERQRQQLVDRFDAEKRKFVELGDTEGYERVQSQERDALKRFEDETAEEPKKDDKDASDASPEDQKVAQKWASANPWFQTDPVLNAVANAHFEQVRKDMPGAGMEGQLDEVRKRVEADYPSKFGNQGNGSGSNTTQRVEGGSRVPGGSGGQRQAAKLPAEAKEAGKEFVEQGLFKDLEEYAKEYFKQEA